MKAFMVCDGIAAPLLQNNIDTDMIVRIERISQLQRGQFGPWAFEMMRYVPEDPAAEAGAQAGAEVGAEVGAGAEGGTGMNAGAGAGAGAGGHATGQDSHQSERENRSFILNQAPFRKAQIILSGRNFGCGSSREMAVWALEEFGIRCVIAQSFGDIFYANCLQNGLLPIRLDATRIEALAAPAGRGEPLCVDLRARTVTAPGLAPIPFDFPDDRREALLEGIDEIDQTLKHDDRIRAFQRRDAARRPWIYARP